MKINSSLLRAALVCVSADEFRPALRGIHISPQYVEATNGHIAVRMSHGAKVKNSIIIRVIGKLPVRAEISCIKLGKEPIAVHYDEHGVRCGVSMLEQISGSVFPDLNKIIHQPKADDLTPAFDIKYMAYPAKMFGARSFAGAKFSYRGQNKPCLISFSRRCASRYGDPIFIISPMRQLKGDFVDE